MMISEPALLCLSATRDRVLRSVPVVRHDGAALLSSVEPSPAVAGPPETPDGAARAMPDDIGAVPAPQLAAHERRARAAALRGLFLARQRRFVSAQRAFTEALQLDSALDLATVPSFWKLERAGHEAAVRAYETVGRGRDAAILASQVRTTFRPRLVPSTRGPAGA